MIKILYIISIVIAEECIFEPLNDNTDFNKSENWGNNSSNCPCEGNNCNINFNELTQSSYIKNIKGTYKTLTLPNNPIILEIIGLFNVTDEFIVQDKVTIYSNSKYFEDLSDVKFKSISIEDSVNSELIINSPFKIGTISCEGIIKLKKNGFISNMLLHGILVIDKNVHITVNKFIGTGRIIMLNGMMLISGRGSSIVNTEIQFGEINQEIIKLIVNNDIQFEKTCFNISQYNEVYCGENPLTLVQSIFGIIQSIKSSFIYHNNSYCESDLSNSLEIKLQVNSLNSTSALCFNIHVIIDF
ncbi:hypothetical protein EDI_317080 [Entamoeba dispar SAW760]|uniref:Uncharacterized protein n=1 Tax=Entamoeba dispar (strain ATCC PRA-260 / SAW760) TaxID=370354 RepID=B0EB34_ENTDS|nr:uncharacterized protein EDI_317080 [Entamoeba dispar SAW760]EDR28251.1 hypothetical protein EDI_317080 [Entamoeba dispar SAW760]|eukprot:EDR28251.1 hypothetical protein EDI_317080 [Entamoeba dispar SAW760]